VASDPDALIEYFVSRGFELKRTGPEASPLSQWLYEDLTKPSGHLVNHAHGDVALLTLAAAFEATGQRPHRAVTDADLVTCRKGDTRFPAVFG
jgi:hypothetical protein